jgi:hypothetical protein
MHDKAVRRRRAVLAALVVLSLFLLTVYFGEPKSGPLHAVQRTTMEIFAPIQEGANRALKPFRDLFGWFGDTLDAKEDRDRYKAERDALNKKLAEVTLENRELEQLKGLEQINTAGGLDDYEPVTARVIARSPSSWYQTFQINKGSSDGVRVNQPVVNSAGLFATQLALVILIGVVTLVLRNRTEPRERALQPMHGLAAPLVAALACLLGAVEDARQAAQCLGQSVDDAGAAGIQLERVERGQAGEALGDLIDAGGNVGPIPYAIRAASTLTLSFSAVTLLGISPSPADLPRFNPLTEEECGALHLEPEPVRFLNPLFESGLREMRPPRSCVEHTATQQKKNPTYHTAT